MDRHNENAGPTYLSFMRWMKWGVIIVALIAAFVVALIAR